MDVITLKFLFFFFGGGRRETERERERERERKGRMGFECFLSFSFPCFCKRRRFFFSGQSRWFCESTTYKGNLNQKNMNRELEGQDIVGFDFF